jgi:hypothetical protein
MRIRVGLAGALAVVAGVALGVALATGTERRGTQTFSYTDTTAVVAPGDQGVARATCGAFTAVGGGIEITPTGRGSEVASSNPDDDGGDPDAIPNDLWEAWANNQRGSGPAIEVVSHVVCEGPGGMQESYWERDFSVPNRTTRTARRACPASETVVSGGAYLSGSGLGAEVPSMGPYDGRDSDRLPDDGFQASASSDGGGAQTATVYAVCSANSEVRYPRRAVRLPRRGRAAVAVGCPGVSFTTGGGAMVSKPTRRIELFASRPYDDADSNSGVGDGWAAGAVSRETKRRTLTATAICVVP